MKKRLAHLQNQSGNVGKGHPDPGIMFAEGQFYLVTQTPKDFVSPGPWVETVEVRVGVDTNNDACLLYTSPSPRD